MKAIEEIKKVSLSPPPKSQEELSPPKIIIDTQETPRTLSPFNDQFDSPKSTKSENATTSSSFLNNIPTSRALNNRRSIVSARLYNKIFDEENYDDKGAVMFGWGKLPFNGGTNVTQMIV